MRCKIINAGSIKHESSLQGFGDFIGANEIQYIDHGKGETYLITKKDKTWQIRVSGNQYDGGFANFYQLLKDNDND